MNREFRCIKITVVGDGNIGKTCMLVSFVHNAFPQEYVPTIFDNHDTVISVDGHEHNISLWDTAGQEEYGKLRPLAYTNTNVFLVCFATNSRASYHNVKLVWIPDVKEHCPDARVVVVGTKVDERPASLERVKDRTFREKFISTREGRKMKTDVGADSYMECSALTQEGLQEVFREAVRCHVMAERRKWDSQHKKCVCNLL